MFLKKSPTPPEDASFVPILLKLIPFSFKEVISDEVPAIIVEQD